jgi:hypothetical protein
MYFTVAVVGYSMFGENTLSQYTLNMPQGLVASKIAVWTTVFYYAHSTLYSTCFLIKLCYLVREISNFIYRVFCFAGG